MTWNTTRMSMTEKKPTAVTRQNRSSLSLTMRIPFFTTAFCQRFFSAALINNSAISGDVTFA